MDEEELGNFMKGAFGLPRSLEGMSVDSLKEYRVALEQEVKRVDAALEHRKGAHAGAEALFKS
ncbi:DUF1192 domain-containing protein [Thalassospira sp. SM2505]|uniref:DUF1192 domain-containing protein n=1 Tax=Thalassospira TaxID=168934 RepID=UPI00215DC3FD|nr:DUF1192 domain-containing protein [Thalassospira profundimaris]